ncbi:DUF3347 domain-containing protein [Chitinophaga cymbidii]|uniref:DUF3347 domain-containing protein n=1 Tax=Chitinophaga cymbidii TaxID=1096750 RepID=A0A512RPV4_9BACT|nr:DUF3347 domain-containing protein [Chitinophaga cymbidii]GEP97722.1 hypothetical protein CCY01nite_39820 [Chitinophaga cymbidii]
MKQFLKSAAAPVLTIVLLAACGNAGEKKGSSTDSTASPAAHNHEAMQGSEVTAASVQLKDDKLNAVYQHYVHLTQALIKGEAKEARLAGNAIETGATAVKGGEAIKAAAAKITATSDIEEQRAAYSTLSNEFILLVKKAGMNNGELYVDFCPMALNDKGGYWLSNNKAIQNPYFGEKMMTCGEVKETIQ